MNERLDQPLKHKQQWVNRWKQCILSSEQVAKKLVAGQQHMAKYCKLLKAKFNGRKINRDRIKQHQREVFEAESKRKVTKMQQHFQSKQVVKSTSRMMTRDKTTRRFQQKIYNAFKILVTPRENSDENTFDDQSNDAPT